MAVNIPCTACERGEHTKCYAEDMEQRGLIESAGFHCSCSDQQHKKLVRPTSYRPYK